MGRETFTGRPEPHKTRYEMVGYLQGKMRSGYERYVDEQRLEWEGGLLKTYLIEADVITDRKNAHDEILAFLRQQSKRMRCHAEELQEENFFALVAPSSIGREQKFDTYYFDASDPRFWVVYTVGHYNRTDHFIDKLVTSSTKLDTAWFPVQFLSQTAKAEGAFIGLGGRFNDSAFVKEEELQQRISMKLWGNLAKEVLKAFNSSDALKGIFSLSSVRLKRYLGEEGTVTDDVYFNGKITSMGQSFASHAALVAAMYKKQYKAKIVDIIEKELSIGSVSEGRGAMLKGEPIFLTFHRKIDNLEGFVKAVYSGTEPFRLWGLQEVTGNDFARVYAVDLHLGRPLTFEVFPDTIRIFLPTGTCGNSVVRFLTLFQQHFDSSAYLSGGDYESLF